MTWSCSIPRFAPRFYYALFPGISRQRFFCWLSLLWSPPWALRLRLLTSGTRLSDAAAHTAADAGGLGRDGCYDNLNDLLINLAPLCSLF